MDIETDGDRQRESDKQGAKQKASERIRNGDTSVQRVRDENSQRDREIQSPRKRKR